MKRPDLPPTGRPAPEPSDGDAPKRGAAPKRAKPAASRAQAEPKATSTPAKTRSVKARSVKTRSPREVDPARKARQDIRAARKRRRAEIRADRRRFTAGRRRRRWMIGGGAAVIGLLFLSVFGVAYSPLMAVKTITVAGTTTIDPAQIQAALSGEIGTPLPLVNPDDIARALAAFPAVQSFSTESVPPSTLIVRIVERTPIGSLNRNRAYDLVDSAGVVLSTTPDAPAGVPVLEVDSTESDAFRTVSSMLLTLPADLRAQAVRAGAESSSDAWFDLASGTHVVWGDANNGVLKLRVLQALLQSAGGSSEINVSAPTSPFVR